MQASSLAIRDGNHKYKKDKMQNEPCGVGMKLGVLVYLMTSRIEIDINAIEVSIDLYVLTYT